MFSYDVQTCQEVEDAADLEDQHMLATLADECKELLKTDTTKFMPVLSKWNPQATAFSATILHRFYGVKLVSIRYSEGSYNSTSILTNTVLFVNMLGQKPFLERAEHLTEEVVSVLSAADTFEKSVLSVIDSISEVVIIDGHRHDKLIPYKVCIMLFL